MARFGLFLVIVVTVSMIRFAFRMFQLGEHGLGVGGLVLAAAGGIGFFMGVQALNRAEAKREASTEPHQQQDMDGGGWTG